MPSSRARWSRPWLRTLALATPALLLIGLWLPGVNQGGFRVDTGLYAAVSHHAWLGGTLFPLMAGDVPYFNKPPMAFWIHGVILRVLGPDLWAARLGALVAAMLGVYATAAFVRTIAGRRTALLAAGVLALTLEWFRYTRAISLDLWLVAWLMLAAWAVVKGAADDQAARARTAWFALAGVMIGLGLLTKPLVALVAIPIFAVWFAVARTPALIGWLGVTVVVAVAVALPWHWAMWARFGDQFVTQYFVKQSAERAVGGAFGAEPWWYYAALLAQTYWPWLPAAVGGAWLAVRPRRAGIAANVRGVMWPLVWVLVWLVALSAFGGKSGRYAVVLYPMLAVLAAVWLAAPGVRWVTIARRALVRWAGPAVVVAGVAMAALGVRVHGPMSAHWAELDEFVRTSRGAGHEVWMHPDMLWTGANVYLDTGAWPRFVGSSGTPGAGDVVVFSDQRDDGDARVAPDAGATEVWRAGRFFAVGVE
jgi:4-amino-4-deoxy-L-arabinose transferase-like glycosyltransferase